MNTFDHQPQLSGNLKFSPYPGIDLTANVNKLPPKWKIAIGLSLAAYGFYLYLNQAKENKARKTN